MLFPRTLALCETQTASSRVWTRSSIPFPSTIIVTLSAPHYIPTCGYAREEKARKRGRVDFYLQNFKTNPSKFDNSWILQKCCRYHIHSFVAKLVVRCLGILLISDLMLEFTYVFFVTWYILYYVYGVSSNFSYNLTLSWVSLFSYPMLFCRFHFLDMKAVKELYGKKKGGQDISYILTLFLGLTTIQWVRNYSWIQIKWQRLQDKV